MTREWLLWLLIILPALAGLAAASLPRPRWVLAGLAAAVLAAGGLDFYAAWLVFSHGAFFAAGGSGSRFATPTASKRACAVCC